MTIQTQSLQQKMFSQRERVPAMYGQVDFSVVPERFTAMAGDSTTLPANLGSKRPQLLANAGRVELMQSYTMIGDAVADAYAALLPQYGMRKLIGMLREACARGLPYVPDAPAELVAFITEMERLPTWLDRELIEAGARKQRSAYAFVTPYAIRGAFFATFMNKYSALPMAITGALTSETAARRVNETAAFFTSTVLPGALERHGEGFRAAAMVRLMHSMVRFNVLARRSDWDIRAYGIPIPQVDQMPAGLINVFLLSRDVLRAGRQHFTHDERAIVELGRYRCYLLGLPEELLADTPQGVVDLWLTRAATLRAGFDDATCGALVRATMAAELWHDASLTGRVQARMEQSFAKAFFVQHFADGDRKAAARVGIALKPSDYAWAGATAVWMTSHMLAYGCAERIPVLRDIADAHLVQKLRKQLAHYGHAEYTTKSESYRKARHTEAPHPASA
jgi:ER-bound oxygenase mpaB/B'/Rubber oxygenase, catalytic domain